MAVWGKVSLHELSLSLLVQTNMFPSVQFLKTWWVFSGSIKIHSIIQKPQAQISLSYLLYLEVPERLLCDKALGNYWKPFKREGL